MIFVTPKYMPVIFSQAMFDAINVYAYLKSHSLKDLLEGISCNVHEFGVNDIMLRLAIHLNYMDVEQLSHEPLNVFLDELQVILTEEPVNSDEYSKGAYLLYLVFSERGELFEEVIPVGPTQEAMDNIKKFLSDVADEAGIILT